MLCLNFFLITFKNLVKNFTKNPQWLSPHVVARSSVQKLEPMVWLATRLLVLVAEPLILVVYT